MLRTVYESDANVLLAARSGSGKGVVAELAMFRLFATQPGGKALVLCPIQAVCDRHVQRWTEMMRPLGKSVGQMIGEPKEDSRTLSTCDVIVSLPEHMDAYTCTGSHLKLIQVGSKRGL